MLSAPAQQADELRTIPGVGQSLAADLRLLGIEEVADLRGRDPEQLYADLQERVGRHVDRCVLSVFRSSVYFAEQKQPELELTKWWNWKDGGAAEERGLI
jgi:nucleotidyltransferase/DNA polymerase involved in DNA repair